MRRFVAHIYNLVGILKTDKKQTMKKNYILATILMLVSMACNNTTKTKESTTSSQSTDTGYDFSETTDKNFCSSDSIVGSDCGGGNILLTKDGNAIYFFFCMGAETSDYLIGKYKSADNGISCTFDQYYSFFSGYDSPEYATEEQKPVDPNAGKMKSMTPWTIVLKKLDCKDFVYTFSDKKTMYVLRKNTDSSKSFQDDVKKIKALADL